MSAKDHLLQLIERVSENHKLTFIGCMVAYLEGKSYRIKGLRQGHTEDEFNKFVEVLDTLQATDLEWYVFFTGDYMYEKDYNFGNDAPWVLSTYEELPDCLIKR